MSTLTRTVLEATSGLAASPVSAVAINLTWAANTRATGYRVYRNGTLIGSPTANSYSDSGLTASTSYTYSVSTVAASGEGPQTAGVQGTTLAAPDTTAPTAPVITATATGQTTISVALTTPATDAQSGVASYDLDYKTAAAGTYTTITPVTAGQFPYIIGGLSAATTHNTRARARDTVGNIGAYSAVSNATTQAATGGTDPYPLYPSFDRNAVPWHTAAGSWGPQYPIVAPTPPATTRNVTVTTTGDFNTQAAIAGTRITIGANFAESSSVQIRANDIDVILPAGRSIGAIEQGAFPWDFDVRRLRIRGSLDGSRGGRMGQFRTPDVANRYSDTIIDGVDMNGAGNFGTGESNQGFRTKILRMFVHNVRGISGGYMSQSGSENIVFANCNFFAGAVNRATAGYNEGWAFRDTSGPIYFIDCKIRTTRYHVLRPYTYDLPGEYVYVKNCDLIQVNEGQIMWAYNRLSEPAFGFALGAIVEDSRIYQAQQSGCGFGPGGQIIDMVNCTYSRIRRNTFYSGGTGNNVNASQSWLDSARTNAISVQNANATLASRGRVPLPADAHVVNDSNTFATLTTLPAWGGPGDPTAIPLPNGWTIAYDEGACPAVFS